MKTLHVYKYGMNTRPYASKLTGAKLIQTALDAAAVGDTVLVHGLHSANPPVRLTYQENLKIRRGVSLVGMSAEWPTIDGGGVDRCIDVFGAMMNTDTVLIEGFEIRNGKTTGSGGGILTKGTQNIIIRNNCIHANRAGRFAGGVGISFERRGTFSAITSTAQVTHNHIHHNSALFGGGVVKYGLGAGISDGSRTFLLANNRIGPKNTANRGAGVLVQYGNAVIQENEIFDNQAVVMSGYEASGGGINVRARESLLAGVYSLYFWTWSEIERWQMVRLIRNSIHHNKAQHDGGGMTVEMAGAVTAEGNTFEKNHALRDDGGGIYATLASSLRLQSGNLIRENTAVENGGGLHVTCGSRALISGSNIIENNHTSLPPATGRYLGGGGISVRESELSIGPGLILRNNTTEGYGGGIFSYTVSHGLSWFSLCNRDTEIKLAGALIEGNWSNLSGAGIAVIKQSAMIPRHPTLIERCLVRNNRSTQPAVGIYIYDSTTPRFHNFQPVIRSCHVEGHRGTRAAGIWIEGVGKTQPTLVDNRVAENGWGVALLENSNALVVGNDISRQVDTDLYAERTSFALVLQNRIDGSPPGAGATRAGIWLVQHRGGAFLLNHIAAHAQHGLLEELTPGGAPIVAPLNWWGDPAGPSIYAGPGSATPPRDTIWQNVVWQPPLAGPLGVTSSAPTSIPVPTLTPAPPQPFDMPSEYPSGVRCE